MKPFISYNQQIFSLKSKGIVIDNKNKTKIKKILINENYYSLINGYRDLFLDNNKKYKKGTHFFEIYALYNFDRDLRNILFKKILIIESKLKSIFSYVFSESYNDNYLNIENYNIVLKDDPTYSNLTPKQLENNNKMLNKACSVINSLCKSISDNSTKKDFITHYLLNHKTVPLWVLINIITLGNLSILYSCLKQRDQQKIAKAFNIQSNNLENYIKILTIFRNICAHEERCYITKVKHKILDTNHHQRLNLQKINNDYFQGKNDLFAVLIILKELLGGKDFKILIKKLKIIFCKLDEKLNIININDVFNIIGFPYNWDNL